MGKSKLLRHPLLITTVGGFFVIASALIQRQPTQTPMTLSQFQSPIAPSANTNHPNPKNDSAASPPVSQYESISAHYKESEFLLLNDQLLELLAEKEEKQIERIECKARIKRLEEIEADLGLRLAAIEQDISAKGKTKEERTRVLELYVQSKIDDTRKHWEHRLRNSSSRMDASIRVTQEVRKEERRLSSLLESAVPRTLAELKVDLAALRAAKLKHEGAVFELAQAKRDRAALQHSIERSNESISEVRKRIEEINKRNVQSI